MSAAHGQLFRRPVWDPRQVVGTTRNALLFCWESLSLVLGGRLASRGSM